MHEEIVVAIPGFIRNIKGDELRNYKLLINDGSRFPHLKEVFPLNNVAVSLCYLLSQRRRPFKTGPWLRKTNGGVQNNNHFDEEISATNTL
jgi:hypothetical protein